MALFQKTVEHKYLKQLDSELINSKYIEFKTYFGNPDIQANIRKSKEEQYQEGFLRELFVKILGYKLNPTSNFNLTTEYKNIKDSKKADGAIILNDVVKAVIELKGTNTTDLSKIEAQAFSYKNNQPDCVYVVTSNFEKICFYIDNAIEHIEFNLFTLSKIDFEVLYLCLSFESIKNGLPKKVKEESLSQEDVITKKLYQDYSLFKRELHQNLVSLNQQYDSLTLFKKSQKLLDRFLFLFFAEDRHLLPPNSVHLVLTDWRDLQERDVEIPLYQRFKKYFEYLNTGYKGKRYDVFAYNGGLFKPDEVLDNIHIDDELLFRHTHKLSDYDFASEVDVNILGHIFENSLNELDEIDARLAGETIDKTKTKRKKEGVFYTPKYITKYIVENTVGKLCSEKKVEFQLIEEDYTTDKKRQLKTKQLLLEKLKTYQNWLLQLTICDPACGSGAFLNQALDFLITEHRYIDELQAKLLDVSLIIGDVEKSILENNLFGVDLNEESVEIAKLSLWLRTAQPNRKLNDLNNNIKCGNSLIDDPAVAGEKAFNWYEEFPTVFHKKDKKGWHITCATHNSRYSQRMLDYHIEWGDAVWLSEKEEIIVIETIAKIAMDDNLNIIACNVCGDHLHLLLVCEEDEVSHIIQKIKSISARECNIATGRTVPAMEAAAETQEPATREHAPLSSSPDVTLSRIQNTTPHTTSTDSSEQKTRGTAQAHLWTQKYGCKEIESAEQLENTIAYIRNNRVKHGLSELGSGSNGSRGSSNKGACSLVSTMCCSTEHAFRPEYSGGFDVVIGNPPWGAKLNELEASYLVSNYPVIPSKIKDTYLYFTIKNICLCKSDAYMGIIIPNTWLLINNAIGFREYILRHKIDIIIDHGDGVFNDAIVESTTLILQKNLEKEQSCQTIRERSGIQLFNHIIDKSIWIEDEFKRIVVDVDASVHKFLMKIENNSERFDKESAIIFGIKPYQVGYGIPKQTQDDVDKRIYHSVQKIGENWFPLVTGTDVNRYSLIFRDNAFIKYGKWLMYFSDEGKINNEKLLLRRTSSDLRVSYDNENFYPQNSLFIITSSNVYSLKYLLVILNSNLFSYIYKNKCPQEGKIFAEVKPSIIKSLPIRNISHVDQQPYIEKADQMLSLNKKLQETSQKFQRSLRRKFNLEELPGKLQDWYLLTYSEFIKELGKKKVKLSLSEEAEWEDYFIQESKKALSIKTQIDTTDKEIDQMVYQLYGLTDEEIAIVEGM